MSQREPQPDWQALCQQATDLGIQDAAALTAEQLQIAVDERRRGADPQQARTQATGRH
jgi:hypothetical protein